MSSTVRIAVVAEGVTDYEVLRAAIESMLNGHSFDMKLLQPEGSVAFTGAAPLVHSEEAGRVYTSGVCRPRQGAVAAYETIHSFSLMIYLSFISMPMLCAKTLQTTR